MPSNITYEELDNLKDCYGKPICWDSDMEEEGYDPPPQVIAYIEERTKMRKVRREAFIKDTRKIERLRLEDSPDDPCIFKISFSLSKCSTNV